jgi:hypothetical protein
MATLPRCKNKNCPLQGTDRNETILLKEAETFWTFGCKACGGLEVRTKPMGWRAGQQENDYQRYGRPEYARTKAFFFLGSRNR